MEPDPTGFNGKKRVEIDAAEPKTLPPLFKPNVYITHNAFQPADRQLT